MAIKFLMAANSYWNEGPSALAGDPAPGDTIIVEKVEALITGPFNLAGVVIDIASGTLGQPAHMEIINGQVSVASDSIILTGAVPGQDPRGHYVGDVNVIKSILVNNGQMLALGKHAQMVVSLGYGTLTNNGFIGAEGAGTEIDIKSEITPNWGNPSAPYVSFNSVVNNSLMRADGGTLTIGAAITGQGTISVEKHGHVTIGSSVASSEFVALTSGMLEIADTARMSFQATVGDLSKASTIQIDGGYADVAARHLTISDITPGGETLNLIAGGKDLFSVKLDGHYGVSDFHVSHVGSSAMIAYHHMLPEVLSA